LTNWGYGSDLLSLVRRPVSNSSRFLSRLAFFCSESLPGLQVWPGIPFLTKSHFSLVQKFSVELSLFSDSYAPRFTNWSLFTEIPFDWKLSVFLSLNFASNVSFANPAVVSLLWALEFGFWGCKILLLGAMGLWDTTVPWVWIFSLLATKDLFGVKPVLTLALMLENFWVDSDRPLLIDEFLGCLVAGWRVLSPLAWEFRLEAVGVVCLQGVSYFMVEPFLVWEVGMQLTLFSFLWARFLSGGSSVAGTWNSFSAFFSAKKLFFRCSIFCSKCQLVPFRGGCSFWVSFSFLTASDSSSSVAH